MQLTERQQSEIKFWNEHAQTHASLNERLLSTETNYEDFFEKSQVRRSIKSFIGSVKGKKLLEFGGGDGFISCMFARSGADVYTFDISSRMVDIIKNRARLMNVDGRIKAEVMCAEKLDYPENSFDIIHGLAILHHIDIPAAIAEAHRVLKPGGKAVFHEACGNNFLFNFARDHLPYRGKHGHATDNPLTVRDIEIVKNMFPNTIAEYYEFSHVGGRALPAYFADRINFDGIDRFLFKVIPGFARYSSVMLLKAQK